MPRARRPRARRGQLGAQAVRGRETAGLAPAMVGELAAGHREEPREGLVVGAGDLVDLAPDRREGELPDVGSLLTRRDPAGEVGERIGHGVLRGGVGDHPRTFGHRPSVTAGVRGVGPRAAMT